MKGPLPPAALSIFSGSPRLRADRDTIVSLKNQWLKPTSSDGFLEFLGGAEGDLLASLDLDLLAGGGVAAHAGGALAHLEDAEADDANALPLLQVCGDHGHQIGQNGFRLLLGQLLLLGDGRREMLQRDRGGGRCFFRHVWPSSLSEDFEKLKRARA